MPNLEADLQAQSFGGFEAGGRFVAVPMTQLIEAVRADRLIQLPTDSPWIIGGLRLREHVVPVVDLQRVMHSSSPNETRQVDYVVIVSSGGRAVGIACERVNEVFDADHVSLSAGQSTQAPGASAGGEHTMIQGYVVRRGTEDAFAILDIARLLESLPTSIRSEKGLRSTTESLGRSFAAGERCVLIRAGGHAFALSTDIVHSTLAFESIEVTPYRGGACMGAIQIGTRSIPAVDLVTLSGVQGAPHQGAGHAVVINTDQGCVALIAEAVLDIAPLPIDAMSIVQRPKGVDTWLVDKAFSSQALKSFALAGSALEPPVYLVIDPQRLRATQQVQNLARLDSNSLKLSLVKGDDPARTVTHHTSVLHYFAGTHAATPLEQIIEIFSLPDLPPQAVSSELDAAPILISRGRAVTVFVLEHLLGLPVKPGRRHALVVEGPDGRIGFSVGALGSIDVIQEEHNLPASSFQDPGVREACNGNCVIVREDKTQALLPHFDLRELAKLHSQVKPQSNAA